MNEILCHVPESLNTMVIRTKGLWKIRGNEVLVLRWLSKIPRMTGLFILEGEIQLNRWKMNQRRT